jgi:hypothetical protein
MRPRTTALASFAIAILAAGFALFPVRAEQIHRHGFNGRQTALVRGDANVRVDEQEHDISTLSFKSQPSSEHIKLTAEAATGDSAYIYYYYDTPQAPINELLTAGVWVKATKTGIQLRARVVFPREPDPANPQLPLTSLIVGKTYDKSRSWEKLTLDDVPELLNKHLPVLQARIGRAVNATDAYIDRLVLNLYAGPGSVDVWVDDLDIGPVKERTDNATIGNTGIPVGRTKPSVPFGAHGRQVEQRGGAMFVDGKPFLFRAIRHSGTPLYVLRQAGFDSLWLPPDVSPELLDEATREGWMVIPSVPLSTAQPNDTAGVNRDADAMAQVIKKFGGIDVLYWDLGRGLKADQAERIFQTCDALRSQDSRRPRGADLFDGIQANSPNLDVVGVHRWPLFTNLDMLRYRDWLSQRKTLTSVRATYWTWIQNHVPDWYIATVMGQKPTDAFTDPIGPHPEQVRLMAYIALASGCRGLGFWSDRFLADSHQGRDRLQGMALLNAEIDMLSPAIMTLSDRPLWLPTSEKNVRAALLQGQRGAVLLPMWFGPNTQFVPDQGSVNSLKITVPLIADGADPWRLTPAGVECLANSAKKIVGGTELTIPEFDYVCPIVFTNDRAGLVVWWQDYVRKYGRLAARWALDMAAVEYEKVYITYSKLKGMGIQGNNNTERLFVLAANYHEEARQNFAAELYSKSYLGALRALRPLRVLMADYWTKAVATLDVPTSSPYAVSFFTLPRHWELFRELQNRKPGENLLPYGEFELDGRIPQAGVRVDTLSGWTSRSGSAETDRVTVDAKLISSQFLEEKAEPRKPPKPVKGIWQAGREIHPPDEGFVRPTPELGKSLLRLEVRRVVEFDKEGKPKEPQQVPLENTFLAVDSPPVKLPPGTLVRVSGWIKIPTDIAASADGVLFYDSAGGEPLGVRLRESTEWRQFHLYRVVPASGQISVTIALTGVGKAYFDNVAIEPMVPVETAPVPPPDNGTVQTAGKKQR